MPETQITNGEPPTTLSQSQLIWRNFKKHRLAIIAGIVLLIMYFIVMICGFLAVHDPNTRFSDYTYLAPQKIHFIGKEGLQRPFVYGIKRSRDPVTFEAIYKIDKSKKHHLYFFTSGNYSYKLMGIWKTNLKLMTTREGPFFPFGTDKLGRDVYSRILYGARLSLTIGLVGVFLSLIIGLILGGVSGFYGGIIDEIIQRIIEFLLSLPKIPLWMALAAALPANWSIMRIYFSITIILSSVGWTSLARVVRGKILALREEEFVLASQACGASDWHIISRHLIPNFMSYILVSITLAIPGMILGETALSFLGLGLRPPAISWGVLLQDAQNVQAIADYPWLLLPALFVILAVLAFNFVGDGLRDAADPYSI